MQPARAEGGPGPSTASSRSARASKHAADGTPGTVRGLASRTVAPDDEINRVDMINHDWYLSHLDRHIRTSYQDTLGSSSTSLPTAKSGFLSPTSQKLFFAALSRHSRLRPDLVAQDAHLSESTVILYLRILGEGERKERRAHEYARGTRDRRKRWTGSHLYVPGSAPSAREVSEEWIKMEEELAERTTKDADEREERERVETAGRDRESVIKSINKDARQPGSTRKENKQRAQAALIEKELEWKLQDWGRQIDGDKLKQLDALMRPYWAEWYHDRVKYPSIDDPLPPADDPALDRKKLNAQEKIIRDDAYLQKLNAIQKRDRTPQQRSDYAKLFNRQRNRTRMRIKCLTEAGMTDEQIEVGGGVDQAYIKWKGWEERLPNGEQEVVAEQTAAAVSAATSLHKQAPRSKSEPADVYAGTGSLHRMKLDSYIMARHLDVINYSSLASLLETRSTTLENLESIQLEFLAYLKDLILRIIVFCEELCRQDDREDRQEITRNHVEQVTAQGSYFLEFLQQASRASHKDRGDVSIEAGRPGAESKEVDGLYTPDFSHEDFDPALDEESREDVKYEEEEMQLDSARDELDLAYDALHEAMLWRLARRAHTSDGEGTSRKDEWHNDTLKTTSKLNWIYLDGDADPDLLKRADQARADYTKLKRQTDSARRKRSRYTRPPVPPPPPPKRGPKACHLSAAFVIDEDDLSTDSEVRSESASSQGDDMRSDSEGEQGLDGGDCVADGKGTDDDEADASGSENARWDSDKEMDDGDTEMREILESDSDD